MATNEFRFYFQAPEYTEFYPLYDNFKVLYNEDGLSSEGSLLVYKKADFDLLLSVINQGVGWQRGLKVTKNGIDWFIGRLNFEKFNVDFDKNTIELFTYNEKRNDNDLMQTQFNALQIVPVQYRSGVGYKQIFSGDTGNIDFYPMDTIADNTRIIWDNNYYWQLGKQEFFNKYPLTYTDANGNKFGTEPVGYLQQNFEILYLLKNETYNYVKHNVQFTTDIKTLYNTNNSFQKSRVIAFFKEYDARYYVGVRDGDKYIWSTPTPTVVSTLPTTGTLNSVIRLDGTYYLCTVASASPSIQIRWVEFSLLRNYELYEDITPDWIDKYEVYSPTVFCPLAGKKSDYFWRISELPAISNFSTSDFIENEGVAVYKRYSLFKAGGGNGLYSFIYPKFMRIGTLLTYAFANFGLTLNLNNGTGVALTSLITIWQKSDLKRRFGNIRATIQNTSITELCEILKSLFDIRLGVDIDTNGLRTYYFYQCNNAYPESSIYDANFKNELDLTTAFDYNVTSKLNFFESTTDGVINKTKVKTEDSEYEISKNVYATTEESKTINVNCDLLGLANNNEKYSDDGWAIAYEYPNGFPDKFEGGSTGYIDTQRRHKLFPTQTIKVPNVKNPMQFNFSNSIKTDLSLICENKLVAMRKMYNFVIESYRFNLNGEADEIKLKMLL